jgi:hypothetical protein
MPYTFLGQEFTTSKIFLASLCKQRPKKKPGAAYKEIH